MLRTMIQYLFDAMLVVTLLIAGYVFLVLALGADLMF